MLVPTRISLWTACGIVSLLGPVAWVTAAPPILPPNLPPLPEQAPSHIDRPSDRQLDEPEFTTPKAAPKLVLPPLAPSDRDKLSAQLKVFVKKFSFTGNQVFSNDDLGKISAAYENRVITSAELQELRNKLTLHYVNNGYINSGVIIPDQKVKDNVIELKVVEGELTTVQIGGLKDLDASYVSERIRLSEGPPLNIKTLQERLQLLQQDPLIKKINAELAPGVQRGESILRVLVEEDRAANGAISFNNHRSPSSGAERLELEAYHRNVSGRGDTLRGRFGLTQGLEDIHVSYELPLNANDTKFNARIERSDSIVVENPFDEIDIESKTDTLAVGIRHPLFKNLSEEFALGLSLETRKSRTFLLDTPFSFSPGAEDGKTRITAVRFSQEWTKRSAGEVFAARSQFSIGMDAFGATIHEDANLPDGKFQSWLGQFQWARRFGENNNQVIFRADMQLADNDLLPLEKFAVGGANSVRGYRENQFVRDNGFVTSLEVRIPIFRDENGLSKWQLAPFVDYGRSWNDGDSGEDPGSISSVGLGLRWQPDPKLRAELYLAEALRNIDNGVDHDLQDSGIHFSVSYSFY